MEFFQSMDLLQKIFWFTAIPVSIIFLIQSIMTFAGLDGGDGIDTDLDGDHSGMDTPFQLFSFRNLINFLLGFGWTGISCYHVIENKNLLIIISFIVGILFVGMFFLIISQLKKLAENNSFNIENTLNKTAEVYLSIPAGKTGKGKIQVSVNGAVHELEAVTEHEKIDTGAFVKVIKIENNNLLLVAKI